MTRAGLTELTAVDVLALLERREVSPVELVEAALERIAVVDGPLNAMPTLCPERALARARRIEQTPPPDPRPRGWLGGLPFAVKDLTDVAGVRTTYGSPIYADHVPERADLLVERLEERGGVVLGKSNTPEFGAGANTFNEVFGETVNPWNTTLTCGGSSGGSAVALASGQAWLATGSDLGGSLRTPASFCAVVGLRPSPGRIASGPRKLPFDTLTVDGPMARTVEDAALLLDAMTGSHPEDPLALDAPARSFRDAAASPKLPARIAFSEDLGLTPVDPEVRRLCRSAAERLAGEGVEVEDACPDLADAPAIFGVLRAVSFSAGLGAEYDDHRELLKPDIQWNVEYGRSFTADDIGRAERARGVLYQRVSAFFERYDLLLCPAACVPPFEVGTRWIRELEGVTFESYVEWLRLTYAITLSACPAISVPCGFTEDGRPVGLQLVGRPRGEGELLAAAAAFEELAGIAPLLPIEPRVSAPGR